MADTEAETSTQAAATYHAAGLSTSDMLDLDQLWDSDEIIRPDLDEPMDRDRLILPHPDVTEEPFHFENDYLPSMFDLEDSLSSGVGALRETEGPDSTCIDSYPSTQRALEKLGSEERQYVFHIE